MDQQNDLNADDQNQAQNLAIIRANRAANRINNNVPRLGKYLRLQKVPHSSTYVFSMRMRAYVMIYSTNILRHMS